MATQRVLEMDFNTVLGRTHRIRVYNANDPLTGAAVSAAMDSIIASNIFTSPGGDLTGKVEARVVITDKSDLILL
jgi:hypothetical protein